MTEQPPHQKAPSSAESRRQLEESVARAMERYKSDFEAVRANTVRLREAREAQELKDVPVAPKARKRAPKS